MHSKFDGKSVENKEKLRKVPEILELHVEAIFLFFVGVPRLPFLFSIDFFWFSRGISSFLNFSDLNYREKAEKHHWKTRDAEARARRQGSLLTRPALVLGALLDMMKFSWFHKFPSYFVGFFSDFFWIFRHFHIQEDFLKLKMLIWLSLAHKNLFFHQKFENLFKKNFRKFFSVNLTCFFSVFVLFCFLNISNFYRRAFQKNAEKRSCSRRTDRPADVKSSKIRSGTGIQRVGLAIFGRNQLRDQKGRKADKRWEKLLFHRKKPTLCRSRVRRTRCVLDFWWRQVPSSQACIRCSSKRIRWFTDGECRIQGKK